MKLTRMVVRGFMSIKEQVAVDVDRKITTLIGANDTGKTNLLKAIRCLNSTHPIARSDKNWDLGKGDEASIEWSFELSESDRSAICKLLEDIFKAQSKDMMINDAPREGLIAISELTPLDADSIPGPRSRH